VEGKVLRRAPVIVLLVGVALAVIGVLGFISGANTDDEAQQVASLRLELREREAEASETRREIIEAGNRLRKAVAALRLAEEEFVYAQRRLIDDQNAAAAVGDAGNVAAARDRFQAEAASFGDLKAKLERQRAAVERVRKATAKLEKGGGP